MAFGEMRMNSEDKFGLVFWFVMAIIALITAAVPIIGIGIIAVAVMVAGSVND